MMQSLGRMGIAVLVLVLVGGGTPASGAPPDRAVGDAAAESTEQTKKRKRKFRRFFNFPTIGDGCGAATGRGPQIRYFAEDLADGPPDSDASVSVGNTSFAVCLYGFAADERVTVHFTWPDGTTTEGSDRVGDAGPGTLATVDFDPLPGMPLGRYELTARQGSTVATGSVTVERPRHPWLGLAAGGHRIGDRLRLVLAGFRADRTVRVAIYRASSDGRCPGRRGRVGGASTYCLTDRRLRARVDAQGDAIVPVSLRASRYRPGSSYIFAARAARMFTTDPVTVCPRGAKQFYCFI
jgi:hypothetical protein